jgi:hypothetical protein
MLFWVIIAFLIALIVVNGYLQLRMLVAAVVAPKEARLMLGGYTGARSWLEEFGFRTIGELLYAPSEQGAAPRVLPALVGADGVTVATIDPDRRGSLTLVSAWSYGGYVVTRCPRRGLTATRNSASVLYRSAPTASEAISLHRAAVGEFSGQHGNPMPANDLNTMLDCYRVAAATWRRDFFRTEALAVLLGICTFATLFAAAFVR